jgi:hypothetical protein
MFLRRSFSDCRCCSICAEAEPDALARQRCSVMTLMPRRRQISFCSIPRAASASALASFLMIAAGECFFTSSSPRAAASDGHPFSSCVSGRESGSKHVGRDKKLRGEKLRHRASGATMGRQKVTADNQQKPPPTSRAAAKGSLRIIPTWPGRSRSPLSRLRQFVPTVCLTPLLRLPTGQNIARL